MTIKNVHLSKQFVLYPPSQPSLEHDSPLWLEYEEEDETYSSPIYKLETTIRGGNPNEDDIIEHILQNQSLNTMSLEEVVKESKNEPQIDLCSIDSKPIHIKRK